MRHEYPKRLLSRVERHVPRLGVHARARLPFRPAPARRLRRLTMSRAAFFCIVAGWAGALAALLIFALAMRWS